MNEARRAGRTELTPRETERLLEAYGFPMAPLRSAGGAAEAIAAEQEIGYSVVLRIASEKFSHKSDVGGVKVDLRNDDEVGAAYRELTEKLKRRDPGMIVVAQKLVSGGREVILGMTRDGQFGPLLMFGLGGVFVEVMRDVSVGIHPLTNVLARGLIERIRGYPILAGASGEPAVAMPLREDSFVVDARVSLRPRTEVHP